MTNRSRYLLPLLTILLVSTPGLGAMSTSHHLLGETPVPNGLSVAFVGDGFDAEGLEIYRKVVTSLASGLRELDVYNVHGPRFNFYRVDVVDPDGKTSSACSPGAVVPSLDDLEVVGDLGPPVDAVQEKDLEVTHCWGGGSPDILYTSMEFEAILLAAAVPDVKTVVIVANARLKAGGAQVLVTPEQTTVVVVGSHVASYDDGATWTIDENAIALLAHELAHSLGLLDEYDHLNTPTAPPFQECRNVWKPNNAPVWPTSPTWPASEKMIPWHGILKTCCTPASMQRCQAHKVNGDCVLEELTTQQAYCAYVPHTANPNGTCYPPLECDAFPGAWEGAHYSETDFYRARKTCRMLGPDVTWKFCEACREYLDIYLEHFGADATGGAWPEARCELSYCTGGSPPEPQELPPAPSGVERTDTR